MAHDALVAIARGLQLACLITWGSVVLVRGGSLWRVLVHGSRSRWDRQWSSITLFALTQAGFSFYWGLFSADVAQRSAVALAWWAPCYLSSALSAVGVVIEHGWWTDGRHRAAMALHVCVILLSVVAAWSVG